MTILVSHNRSFNYSDLPFFLFDIRKKPKVFLCNTNLLLNTLKLKQVSFFRETQNLTQALSFPFNMDPLALTPTSHQLHFKLQGLSCSPQLGKHSKGKTNFSKGYRNKAFTGKPTPAETPKCGRFCPSFPVFQTDQEVCFFFTCSGVPACSCFTWIVL